LLKSEREGERDAKLPKLLLLNERGRHACMPVVKGKGKKHSIGERQGERRRQRGRKRTNKKQAEHTKLPSPLLSPSSRTRILFSLSPSFFA
jgi:hypothetical protein